MGGGINWEVYCEIGDETLPSYIGSIIRNRDKIDKGSL